MFRCQLCDTIVPRSVRSHKVVVQTRPKQYAARGSRPSEFRFGRGRGGFVRKQTWDKGGEGTEIVKELLVCPRCAQQQGGGTS